RRILHYRKRHPWYPETWATPGSRAYPTVRVGPLTVSCAICFDAQFFEEETPEAFDEADLLLFPSAWVEEEDHRAEIFRELGRRYGLAVANANWGKGSPAVPGQGGSMIVGPAGEVLAAAGDGAVRIDATVRAKARRAS